MTLRKPRAVKKTFWPKLREALMRSGPKRPALMAASPFDPYVPMKGVVPEGEKLAMDSALGGASIWAAQAVYNAAFYEGVTFLGYPYLAELAQRPEYRRISEVIATEATRKWIKLSAVGEGKDDKVKHLETALKHFNVQHLFRKISECDGFFGRAHLYVDIGDTEEREELITPIGNGRNNASKLKVSRGSLKRFKVIEPVWTYPANYNANDPLKTDWYKPETWFVMGKQIHSSRLMTFVAREVPDLLKPAYSFGGLSLSQMAKPYVDNWLTTRQSVNDLIKAFSVMVLKTDLSTALNEGGDALFNRVELFNNLRDNKGAFVINKDTEEFQNVSAPLGGLEALQAQAQEHMCSVTGTPVVKLLGIQPAGLNASSEGELQTWYDWVAAYQELMFRTNLTRVIDFVQLNEFGEVDEEITFAFEPLREMSEKERSELRKSDADAAAIYVDMGAIAPEEVRGVLANDPDSVYSGLDVNNLPEPPVDPNAELEAMNGEPERPEDAGEPSGGTSVRVKLNGGAPKETRP